MTDAIECPKCSKVHAACAAHARSGEPCKREPSAWQKVCTMHGGASPRALQAAAKREAAAILVQTYDADHEAILAAAGHYKTADVLAALGVAPAAPAQPPLADWERDLLGPQTDGERYWHKQAERFKGALEEIEGLMDRAILGGPTWRAVRDVTKEALHPTPPFELPTEAGTRFTAQRVGNLAHTSEFVTITDGAQTAFYFIREDSDGYTTETDRLWPAGRVMADWTGHRLIGAGQ